MLLILQEYKAKPAKVLSVKPAEVLSVKAEKVLRIIGFQRKRPT